MCDTFFTAVKLAISLHVMKVCIVGKMNRARRNVPAGIRKKRQPLCSSIFLKSDDIALTVYQGEPSKSVLLPRTVHATVLVYSGPKKLPECITCYISTKLAVGDVDQMGRPYTTKVSCRH